MSELEIRNEQEAWCTNIGPLSYRTYNRTSGLKSGFRKISAWISCVATTIQTGSDCRCSSKTISCSIACFVSITRGSNVPNESSVATCVITATFCSARVLNVTSCSPKGSKSSTADFSSARVYYVSNFSSRGSSYVACAISFATIHHNWDRRIRTSINPIAASILAYLAGELSTGSSFRADTAIPSTRSRAGGGGVAIDETTDTINIARRARLWGGL